MESDEFLGNTPIFFDGKDRFNVPARVKSILEDKYTSNLIICVKKDHIRIFPQQKWEETKKTWEALIAYGDDDDVIVNRRKALAHTSHYEMKSGKILITADQRKRVGLTEKEAVLVGMSDFFEVWPKELFEKEYG